MDRTPTYQKEKLILYYVILVVSVLSYITYLLFDINFEASRDYTILIYILSWLGVIAAIYVIFTWYKLSGKVFSLYTIFMLFFFLFNYGQPLMWAFGVHQQDEIGQGVLYTLDSPSSSDIVYTQAITLICIIMFHLGATFCYKPKSSITHRSSSSLMDQELTFKAIFYTSVILSIFVIPITFFNSIYDLIYSHVHGYSALYYDDSKSEILLFNLLSRMFFPCLVGLLLGSKFSKRIRISVYMIFILYLIINLLSGDRGSWIYSLILLIFLSHTFYKKFSWKQILIGLGFGTLFLYLVNIAVVLRRTSEISLENIINSFTLKNSPIINFIFEMGGSMKPALVLVQNGWDIWPNINSYLSAFVGLIPTQLLNMFNIPFQRMGEWFSQDYLGISYGAGFSITAESLLNFGPIIAPIFMILLGYIINSLIYLDKNIKLEGNVLKIFFSVTTTSVFVHIIRGHFQHVLNQWVYSVIPIIVIVLLMKAYLNRKTKN